MQNNVGIYASQISGHLWAPNGAYDALATISVPAGNNIASVEFSGIPQGYKHLQIRASYSTSVDVPLLRFNGTSGGTAYDFHGIRGNGSTASAYAITNAAHVQIGTGLGTSSTIYSLIIDILDYTSNTKNKVVRFMYGYDTNGGGQIEFVSGLYRSTSPVTSIQLPAASGNIGQYSQFALYGVK